MATLFITSRSKANGPDGALVDLLIRVNPGKYEKYVVYENGKKVLYVKLQKALYGTLQVALLFWENVSAFLVNELAFEMNPYDKCVVNKIINGKQCTIIWHVDDFKLSHVEQNVLKWIAKKLDECY